MASTVVKEYSKILEQLNAGQNTKNAVAKQNEVRECHAQYDEVLALGNIDLMWS